MKIFAFIIFAILFCILYSCDSNQPSTKYIYVEEDTYDDEYYEDESSSGEYEFPTEFVQCPLCHGLTTCGGCAGQGTLYLFGEWKECSACGGSTYCSFCEGKGYVEQLKRW